ncbi:MAG: zinc ABC transporter substrate-binding protein [Alphaproteobacteria bacterium]
MSKRYAQTLFSAFALSVLSITASAQEGHDQDKLYVLSSIKPVHSLVAMVTGDLANSEIIVKGAASPHTYALAPAQARDIQRADAIFWVGEDLEAFLEKPLATIGARATLIELMETPGLQKLKFREGGAFEKHDDHDDDDHDDDHDKHDDHDEDHDDDHGNHDYHDGFDPHIWLSPDNAKRILAYIASALGDLDPDNKAAYIANATAAMQDIDQLTDAITDNLSPIKNGGFLLFHDSFQYFEHAFGLAASGAISIHPEVAPGARRIAEIRRLLRKRNVRCVFTEPQFDAKMVDVILQGTGKKAVEIDPLGAALPQGDTLYFELMQAMSTSFRKCLG